MGPGWTRMTEEGVNDLIAGLGNVEDLIPKRFKEQLARERTGNGTEAVLPSESQTDKQQRR